MSNIYNNVNLNYQIPAEHNVTTLTFDEGWETSARPILVDKIVTISDLKAETELERDMVTVATTVAAIAIAVLSIVLAVKVAPIFLVFILLAAFVATMAMCNDEEKVEKLEEIEGFLKDLELAHKNLEQPEFLSWIESKLGTTSNLEQLLKGSRSYTQLEKGQVYPQLEEGQEPASSNANSGERYSNVYPTAPAYSPSPEYIY